MASDCSGVSIQSLLDELPSWARVHLLYNHSRQFQTHPEAISKNLDLFATITKLDFSDCFPSLLNLDKFARISLLPISQSLTHLNLSNCRFGDFGVGVDFLQAIGTLPIFNHLETLTMTNCSLQSLDPLLNGANSFPRLRSLDLGDGGTDISILRTTTKMKHLKHFGFGFVSNQTDLSKVLSRGDQFSDLDEISISSYTLNDLTLLPILRSHNLRRLKTLSLSSTRASSGTIRAMICENLFPDLTSLKLAENGGINDECLVALCQSSQLLPQLSTLFLHFCSFTAIGLEALGKSPHARNLKSLHMCSSGDVNTIQPFLSHYQGRLRELSLTQFGFQLSDFDLISSSPSLSQLEVLKINDIKQIREMEGEDHRGKEGEIRHNWWGFDHKLLSPNLNISIQNLSRSPILGNLLHLELTSYYRTPLTPETVLILLKSPFLSPKLVKLSLTIERLTAEICQCFASELVNPNDENSGWKFAFLEEVKLLGCRIEEKELKFLEQLPIVFQV